MTKKGHILPGGSFPGTSERTLNLLREARQETLDRLDRLLTSHLARTALDSLGELSDWIAFRQGLWGNALEELLGERPALFSGREQRSPSSDHWLAFEVVPRKQTDCLFFASRPQYVDTLAEVARAAQAAGSSVAFWPATKEALSAATACGLAPLVPPLQPPPQPPPGAMRILTDRGTDDIPNLSSILTYFVCVRRLLLDFWARSSVGTVIVARCWRPLERLVVQSAHEAGVRTVIVNHSHLHRFGAHEQLFTGSLSCDLLCLWNKGQAAAVRPSPHPKKLAVTGIPAWSRAAWQVRLGSREVRPPLPTILWTVQPPWFSRHVDVLTEAVSGLPARTVARLHPSFASDYSELNESEMAVELASSRPALDALIQSDICIVYDSSLLSLAALLGRKVIALQAKVKDADRHFLVGPDPADLGIPICASAVELREEIERALGQVLTDQRPGNRESFTRIDAAAADGSAAAIVVSELTT